MRISTSPAQVTGQGSVERRCGGDHLVVDGIIVALFAHVGYEFLDHLPVSRPDGSRVGDHSQVGGFQILKKNIALERQVELCLIQQMKDNDIVASEAKLAQPVKNLLRLVEQIRHQHDQAAPLDLAGDFLEDLS